MPSTPRFRVVASVLLCLACFPLLRGQTTASSSSINEKNYVEIGGIKQWITIKGSHRSNPVVLFVHGGPGNPMSPFSETLYKEWENEFTIVQWDQRGCGKTYEANQPAGEISEDLLNRTPLNFDLIVSDGIEVANPLRTKLGVEKIILTGTSWGSAVAAVMASKSPGAFHAYVGISQLVNYDFNLTRSYERLIQLARTDADQATLQLLESLGPPPWKNPRNFGRLRRAVRQYESKKIDPGLNLEMAADYDTPIYRAAYASGEEFSFIKYVGFNNDGMAKSVALDRECTRIDVPVFILQGAEDLHTLPEVTESYVNALAAPQKSYRKVERCGHDPDRRMLDEQLATLRKLAGTLRTNPVPGPAQ